MASFFFCDFVHPDILSIKKSAKGKLGRRSTVLTSRLFNNTYKSMNFLPVFYDFWRDLITKGRESASRLLFIMLEFFHHFSDAKARSIIGAI